MIDIQIAEVVHCDDDIEIIYIDASEYPRNWIVFAKSNSILHISKSFFKDGKQVTIPEKLMSIKSEVVKLVKKYWGCIQE